MAEDLIEFLERVKSEGKVAIRSATDDEIKTAREIASVEIDRIFVFKGHKASISQEMSWPRVGVDGFDSATVPECVTQATYFLGGAYLAGYHIGPDNLELSKGLVACLFLMLDPVIDPDASARNTRASH